MCYLHIWESPYIDLYTTENPVLCADFITRFGNPLPFLEFFTSTIS